METALLAAAVLVAGLACPAMMWWQRRRGREAACCMPRDSDAEGGTELAELRRRHDALSMRLAELRGEPQPLTPGAPGGRPDG
ncbi:MAG: hypothetical protein ACR2G3_09285 [Solirubrobacterales bacterium]